jgi:hypothetical protein
LKATVALRNYRQKTGETWLQRFWIFDSRFRIKRKVEEG